MLVHGNIEIAVVIGTHEGEGENVDASHWRCEEPGVSVVAAADVGDDGVEEEDVVSAHVDGGLAEAHGEDHSQGMESGSQTQFGVVVESINHLLIVVSVWTSSDMCAHVTVRVCVYVCVCMCVCMCVCVCVCLCVFVCDV